MNKLVSSEKVVRDVLKEISIDVPIIPCSAEADRGIDDLRSLFTESINSKEEQLPS